MHVFKQAARGSAMRVRATSMNQPASAAVAATAAAADKRLLCAGKSSREPPTSLDAHVVERKTTRTRRCHLGRRRGARCALLVTRRLNRCAQLDFCTSSLRACARVGIIDR